MNKIATERVFAEDADGVTRLVAAPGDVIPDEVVTPILQAPPDPPEVAPIDDYDSLSEDEVLERLPELDAETLEVVRAYEQAHLARGTITRYGLTSQVVDVVPDGKAATVPATPAATEPFEGYDGMAADDIVERMNAASDDEVAAVKAYEATRKRPRKTIVSFERSAPVPFEGYDDLDADDVVERLKDASDDEVAAVKAYEAEHENRTTIVEFERE